MKSLFSHRGAAAVEFALVLIPLIILTFGLIEFGLLMYNQQVLTNATREGARYGIVMTTPTNPITPAMTKQVVSDYALSHLITLGSGGGNLNPTADRACGPGTFGSDLTVGATYDYAFLVTANFIPTLGPIITLSSQSVMKCE